MLKVPLLLFVLGSASLWVLAEGDSTVRPEDGVVTPGAEDGTVSPGVEDGTMSPGVEDGAVSPGVEDGAVSPGVEDGAVSPGVEDGAVSPGVEDGAVSPGVEDGAVSPGVEDDLVTPGTSEQPVKSAGLTTQGLTTTKSVTVIRLTDRTPLESTEESQKTTTSNVGTGHSEEVGGEASPTVENDGLTAVTLVGIIAGVLLATAFVGGIISVVVRKTSGRYTP